MSSALSEQRTRRLRLPSFGIQVLIGLVLGVVLGLVARSIGPDGVEDPNWLTETLSTVGGVFVTLLRTIVPPLVFPSAGQGLTFSMTVAAVGMVYEWTHYLVHTDYKPQTHRVYRSSEYPRKVTVRVIP